MLNGIQRTFVASLREKSDFKKTGSNIDNETKGLAIVREALVADRGGLRAALYMLTVPENCLLLGDEFFRKLSIGYEPVAFLADSLRSLGYAERVEVMADLIRFAGDQSDQGYLLRRKRSFIVASAFFPEKTPSENAEGRRAFNLTLYLLERAVEDDLDEIEDVPGTLVDVMTSAREHSLTV